MKISKSKQELARTIRENGGWRGTANIALFGKASGVCHMLKTDELPKYDSSINGFYICARSVVSGFPCAAFKNWHQTVLSREEYFHLYPAPDAEGWIEWSGGECPVDKDARIDIRMTGGKTYYDTDTHWGWNANLFKITHYRLHEKEKYKHQFCESVMGSIPEPSDKPTIEQLAAEYQSKLAIATRAQEEADAHRCGAEVALSKLEIAMKELGFKTELVTAKKEPELVITDWRDLQAGDVISVSGKWWGPDSEYTVDENDGSRDAPIRVGGYWALIGECSFKFIRRP